MTGHRHDRHACDRHALTQAGPKTCHHGASVVPENALGIWEVECQSLDGVCRDASQQDPNAAKSVHPVIVVEATLIEDDSDDPWYKFW